MLYPTELRPHVSFIFSLAAFLEPATEQPFGRLRILGKIDLQRRDVE
jgi:hypothetical protein